MLTRGHALSMFRDINAIMDFWQPVSVPHRAPSAGARWHKIQGLPSLLAHYGKVAEHLPGYPHQYKIPPHKPCFFGLVIEGAGVVVSGDLAQAPQMWYPSGGDVAASFQGSQMGAALGAGKHADQRTVVVTLGKDGVVDRSKRKPTMPKGGRANGQARKKQEVRLSY